MPSAPAPLFRDPVFDGAADPTLIWNVAEQAWWMLYTNRRANVVCRGFAWVHGTDIGVASTSDQGQTWTYRGVLAGLAFEPGRNTYWAPEVVWHDHVYHMYLSYVPGVPHAWTGTRTLHHLTSRNLWDWRHEGQVALSSDYVIDACVLRLPGGGWRMWYKDEANGSHTFVADSPDLYDWTVTGPVITDRPHEGPNVFFWRGSYWMITDPWNGLGVYRSDDAERWARQDTHLLDRPGRRVDDATQGLHADVVVQGEQAYVFYFTHPDRTPNKHFSPEETQPFDYKRSSLQVARLEVDGDILTCDRDAEFDFRLGPPAPELPRETGKTA